MGPARKYCRLPRWVTFVVTVVMDFVRIMCGSEEEGLDHVARCVWVETLKDWIRIEHLISVLLQ